MSLQSTVVNRLTRNKSDSKSHKIESYLQKMAALTVRSRTDVNLVSGLPTARCRWDSPEHVIEIRSENLEIDYSEMPKKFRDYDMDYIDLLAKEGFLYHELGHVLYTDYDAWMSTIEKEPIMQRDGVKQLMNAGEDAVIEAYLDEKYGIGNVLTLKNELKHASYPVDQDRYEDCTPTDVATAVFDDRGRYNTGLIDRHQNAAVSFEIEIEDAFSITADEVIKAATKTLYEAIKTPDASERYELFADLYNDIHDNMESEQKIPRGPSGGTSEDPAKSDAEKQAMMVPVPDLDGDDDGDGDGDEDGQEAGEDGEEQDGQDPDGQGEDSQDGSQDGEEDGEGDGDGEGGEGDEGGDGEGGDGGGDGLSREDVLGPHAEHNVVLKE